MLRAHYCRHNVSAECRTSHKKELRFGVYLKLCTVCCESRLNHAGYSRRQVSSYRCCAIEHNARLKFLYYFHGRLCVCSCDVLCKLGRIDNGNGIRTVFNSFFCYAVCILSQYEGNYLLIENGCELNGLPDKLCGNLLHYAVSLLHKYEYVLAHLKCPPSDYVLLSKLFDDDTNRFVRIYLVLLALCLGLFCEALLDPRR